ncbi:MAG: competence/damage-inducible protein A [Candidatus Kapabacteria bacterium]|nr:competence/damage-inducible protein A [Candidatus Kapabacteria bacterium]MDW8224983.1 competence/damage-inducible protein A [Bacteroidota bacterium]
MASAAILGIGNELLLGQVTNTNAAWLAQRCSEVGFRVVHQSVVGDSVPEIVQELRRLWERVELIVTTGGLGPTHDDVTVEALAQFLGEELQEHPTVREWLVEKARQRGQPSPERVLRQALLPPSALPLPNPVGQAPGIWIERDGKAVLALPGVPAEMQAIVQTAAVDYLRRLRQRLGSGVTFRSINLVTAGIAEARLADLIGPPEDLLPDGVTLAFLPSFWGVRLRLDVYADSPEMAEQRLEQARQRLQERIQPYLLGEGEVHLSYVVGEELRRRGETLAVAESCTGGLLGAAITDIPGSSDYFLGGHIAYSNAAKTTFLQVPPELLQSVGAVSQEVAELLAENVRRAFGATYGIGITGIAGPGGGTPQKPVGTVWIGLATPERVSARRFVFGTDRAANRQRSVAAALTWLYRYLKGLPEE